MAHTGLIDVGIGNLDVMPRRTLTATVCAGSLLLFAPACSSNTKDDVKTTISDLSTDASTAATNASSSASSAASDLKTDDSPASTTGN